MRFPAVIPQHVAMCPQYIAACCAMFYRMKCRGMSRHFGADAETFGGYRGICRHVATRRGTCHDISWVPMGSHGKPWHVPRHVPRHPATSRGTCHGNPWERHGSPCEPMTCLGMFHDVSQKNTKILSVYPTDLPSRRGDSVIRLTLGELLVNIFASGQTDE